MKTPAALPDPLPVRYDWLAHAAEAARRTKALHLAVSLCWLAASSGAPGVSLTRRTLRDWGLSRDAAYDALRTLKAAGCLFWWSLPGRAHRVLLVEVGTDQPLRLGGPAGQ